MAAHDSETHNHHHSHHHQNEEPAKDHQHEEQHSHGHHHGHHHDHAHNEKRTLWVVLLTAVTMSIEITYGLTTKSMALLADGIHMGSHVLAIGISWLAYVFVRKLKAKKSFTGDTDKILSLSGYSSGLFLLVFALFILVEAVQRFLSPQEIQYSDAIIVAIIGLVVNVASAFLLQHDHEHADHNIRAAYLHVIADAFTSVAAIAGLLAARYWQAYWVDTAVAVVSSFVIIRWAINLLKETGRSLLN